MNRTAIVLCTVVAAAGLAACSSDDTAPQAPEASKSVAIPKASASQQIADGLAKLGIPRRPDAATQARYIVALTSIDPDIVHGKPDKAVDRGRNQCSVIASNPKDQAKQVELANKRFTSPAHPDGFGLAKAAEVNEVVHAQLCPGS
ncbi:hypothetical protein ACFWBX_22835 [Streptomyces sp. NPDC059991]|uniref:hypothetical protein n=1 Tax=Streptomyces sp. NPDC059991 TaxID=3347028 RepID=UPI0036C33F92